MSLKHKLTALFAVSLIVLMAIMAQAALRVARLTVQAELKERMDAAAFDIHDALLREVQRRGYLTDQNARSVMNQALGAHPFLYRVDLTYWNGNIPNGLSFTITPYGLLFARFGSKAAEKGPRTDEHTYRQQYKLPLSAMIYAELGLEASLTEADKLAARISRMSLLITGCGLLIMLGIIYYLSHRLVSAPLGKLSQLTGRVAQGDLEVVPPAAMASRADEVGELASAFQDMVVALRRTNLENQLLLSRMQGFNRELEARVEEATGDLKEKNEALIEAREELARRERLAALGQLAGSIAHEIGTPLSTLSGYLQLVLADPRLESDVREPLEVANGEAQRVTRIIRRFLDSTRGLRPQLEPIDLKALIDDVVALTLPPAIRERHPIRLEIDPAAAQIETDPGLLRHVLTNLVKNAVDAMDEGGALTFRGNREGMDLVLEVEDEGPGVAPANREQIFTPFFTTKEVGQGTGLGLAICQEIMRALKGTLTVEDARSGRGARFVVRLPAFSPAPESYASTPGGADGAMV